MLVILELIEIITILNPQSYPSVGGNWTVHFNTTGKADLTITPVNNTYFGVDIQFLELRCGDEVVNATCNGTSVFYADWNCSDSETGYFIVKVLKAGNHTLEFRFGDDVGYAYNSPSSLSAKVGTFTALSGIGNQRITGVGFQPKAVLFWITDRTSTGNSPDVRFGRGWTDGTNEFAEAVARQDGTNNSRDRVVNDKVITLIDAGGSVLAEASIVSLDSDGFTINWTTAGAFRKVTYLALGGPSLTNVKAGGFLCPWTGESYSETGVGFEPDAVIFGGSEDQTA